MRVRLLAFAAIHEILGARELTVELPEGSRISDVWSRLTREHAALSGVSQPLAAVNQQFERTDAALHEGDELAFIPPVSGG